MEPTFRISALGIQPGHDSQAVRAELQPLIKGKPADFEDLFHYISLGQRVVLGENIEQEKAESLLEKLTALGLKCRMDPMKLTLAGLESRPAGKTMHRCPACHHCQPPATDGRMDICERCGVVGQNYEATAHLRYALERERQRLKALKGNEEDDEREALEEKANKRRAMAQQKILDQARRQAEKEFGIGLYHKLRFLLKPDVLYPLLGSLTVALIGVGLLVWQLLLKEGSPQEEVVANAKPVGLQLTVTPAAGAVFKVEGMPQIAQSGAAVPDAIEGGVPSATANTSASGVTTGVAAAGTSATPAMGKAGEVGTATTATATQSGSVSGSSAGAGKANKDKASEGSTATPTDAKHTSLLKVDQLALVTPAKDAASSSKATRDPQLLASLARYQLKTGDLKAAVRSIDRAIELLSTKRNSLSSTQLDAFNRIQAEVRAEIAQQYHQQKELATAQTYWFRSISLANSITTPSEQALALSGLAQTLNEAQATTAKDYFSRAIEATRLITEPLNQALVLGTIARDLALTGRLEQSQALFDQAAVLVNALPEPEKRLMAQARLAKHRAEAGDTVVVKVLLEQVASAAKGDPLLPELGQYQAEAFSALAFSLASRGETAMARMDFAAALQQAQALTDPTRRAETLLYLARDIAAAGDRVAAGKLVAAARTWD